MTEYPLLSPESAHIKRRRRERAPPLSTPTKPTNQQTNKQTNEPSRMWKGHITPTNKQAKKERHKKNTGANPTNKRTMSSMINSSWTTTTNHPPLPSTPQTKLSSKMTLDILSSKMNLMTMKQRSSDTSSTVCSTCSTIGIDGSSSPFLSTSTTGTSSSSPSSSSPVSMKRAVSFDKIQVRGYGIALGDNPSCSRGPALTLNWDYDDELKVSVDEYEKIRCNTRRSKYEMLVPSVIRETTLRSQVYSRSDLKEAEKQSMKIQRSRYKNSRPLTKRQERTAELLESTRKVLSSPSLLIVKRGSNDNLMVTTTATGRGGGSSSRLLLLKPTRKVVSMNDIIGTTPETSSSCNKKATWPTKGILKV